MTKAVPLTDRPRQPTAASRVRFLLLVIDGTEVTDLAKELSDHDIDVVVCADPAEALLEAGSLRPDAVLAAAQLRPLDSAVLVRVLSQRSGIPVLLGVGDDDGQYAAAALRAGATACVARPYRPREVVPILRAIRPDTVEASDPPVQVTATSLNPAALEAYLHARPIALTAVKATLQVGGLRLDPVAQEAYLHNKRIHLPMRECLLLHFLMQNADRLVTREEIIAAVWTNNSAGSSNTVNVHIQRLRARFGDDPHHAHIIQTIRKKGYRLLPPTRRKAKG